MAAVLSLAIPVAVTVSSSVSIQKWKETFEGGGELWGDHILARKKHLQTFLRETTYILRQLQKFYSQMLEENVIKV